MVPGCASREKALAAAGASTQQPSRASSSEEEENGVTHPPLLALAAVATRHPDTTRDVSVLLRVTAFLPDAETQRLAACSRRSRAIVLTNAPPTAPAIVVYATRRPHFGLRDASRNPFIPERAWVATDAYAAACAELQSVAMEMDTFLPVLSTARLDPVRMLALLNQWHALGFDAALGGGVTLEHLYFRRRWRKPVERTLFANRDLVLAALDRHVSPGFLDDFVDVFVDEALFNDEAFCLDALELHATLFWRASAAFRASRAFVLEAVRRNTAVADVVRARTVGDLGRMRVDDDVVVVEAPTRHQPRQQQHPVTFGGGPEPARPGARGAAETACPRPQQQEQPRHPPTFGQPTPSKNGEVAAMASSSSSSGGAGVVVVGAPPPPRGLPDGRPPANDGCGGVPRRPPALDLRIASEPAPPPSGGHRPHSSGMRRQHRRYHAGLGHAGLLPPTDWTWTAGAPSASTTSSLSFGYTTTMLQQPVEVPSPPDSAPLAPSRNPWRDPHHPPSGGGGVSPPHGGPPGGADVAMIPPTASFYNVPAFGLTTGTHGATHGAASDHRDNGTRHEYHHHALWNPSSVAGGVPGSHTP